MMDLITQNAMQAASSHCAVELTSVHVRCSNTVHMRVEQAHTMHSKRRSLVYHMCKLCAPDLPSLQVLVKGQKRASAYINYILVLLEQKGHENVIIKARGKTIDKAILIG